jgi:hypothetical protein
MRPAAKTKPAGTALTVELNFLVATHVVSGNGCCECLETIQLSEGVRQALALSHFPTHKMTSRLPGVHRDAYRQSQLDNRACEQLLIAAEMLGGIPIAFSFLARDSTVYPIGYKPLDEGEMIELLINEHCRLCKYRNRPI